MVRSQIHIQPPSGPEEEILGHLRRQTSGSDRSVLRMRESVDVLTPAVLAWLGNDGKKNEKGKGKNATPQSEIPKPEDLRVPQSHRRQCRVVKPLNFKVCIPAPGRSAHTSDRNAVHVFFETHDNCQLDDIYLASRPNWKRELAELCSMMDAGRLHGVQDVLLVDCPVNLINRSQLDRLSMQAQQQLETDIRLVCSNSFAAVFNSDLYHESETWECRTTYLERGEVANRGNEAKEVQVSHQWDRPNRSERVLPISLGSLYLMKKVDHYADMLEDRSQHSNLREDIRNMVAVQELRRKSDDTRDGNWTTVAVVLWHFRVDRASLDPTARPEGTTWRNVCISYTEPVNSYAPPLVPGGYSAEAMPRSYHSGCEPSHTSSQALPLTPGPGSNSVTTANENTFAYDAILADFPHDDFDWSWSHQANFAATGVGADPTTTDFGARENAYGATGLDLGNPDSALDTEGNIFNFANYTPKAGLPAEMREKKPSAPLLDPGFWDDTEMRGTSNANDAIAETLPGAPASSLQIEVPQIQEAVYSQSDSSNSQPTSAASSFAFSVGPLSPVADYSSWASNHQAPSRQQPSVSSTRTERFPPSFPNQSFAVPQLDVGFLADPIFQSDHAHVQAHPTPHAMRTTQQPHHTWFSQPPRSPYRSSLPATPLQTLRSQPPAQFPAQVATPMASPERHEDEAQPQSHSRFQGHLSHLPDLLTPTRSDFEVDNTSDGNHFCGEDQVTDSHPSPTRPCIQSEPRATSPSHEYSLDGHAEESFHNHPTYYPSHASPTHPADPSYTNMSPYLAPTAPGQSLYPHVPRSARERGYTSPPPPAASFHGPVGWLHDDDEALHDYTVVPAARDTRPGSFTHAGAGEDDKLARLFHPTYFGAAEADAMEEEGQAYCRCGGGFC